MLKYIGKRLLMMIPVILGISFIIFAITDLTPGDPARMVLGEGATPEAVEQKREEMALMSHSLCAMQTLYVVCFEENFRILMLQTNR